MFRCLECLSWDDQQRSTEPNHWMVNESAFIQRHLKRHQKVSIASKGAGAGPTVPNATMIKYIDIINLIYFTNT